MYINGIQYSNWRKDQITEGVKVGFCMLQLEPEFHFYYNRLGSHRYWISDKLASHYIQD